MSEGRLTAAVNPVTGIDVIQSERQVHKRPPTADELARRCSLKVPKCGRFSALTWNSLPWFGRYSGCRIGELSQLTVDDIIVKNGIRCLRITGMNSKQLKAESSERLVPVSDRLAPRLDRVLAVRKKGGLRLRSFISFCSRCHSSGLTIASCSPLYNSPLF